MVRVTGGDGRRPGGRCRGDRDPVGVGVEFPFYPPPGIIILLAGAIFVGLAPWPWAPAVGAFLGLFLTVGFVVSGGPPNLVGEDGTRVAIGTWIQMIGVLTALIAGVIATRANYRTPARVRE
jgi:hypothetical protein